MVSKLTPDQVYSIHKGQGKLITSYKSNEGVKSIVNYYLIYYNQEGQDKFIKLVKAIGLKVNIEIREWGVVEGIKVCSERMILNHMYVKSHSFKDKEAIEALLQLTKLHFPTYNIEF